MTIEQQVCTLEQAKRLKELGVGQESMFAYHIPSGRLACAAIHGEDFKRWDEGYCAAFTVSELGELLRPYTNAHQNNQMLPEYYYDSLTWFYRVKMIDNKKWIQGNTEAQCRAAMLIYLLENKLM